MKILSWNVAGLRACINKGFFDSIAPIDADIICLQEVKATQRQFTWQGKHATYVNPAAKAGYSGTLLATNMPVEEVVVNFGTGEYTTEGRSIIASYPEFFLINLYVPNSQEGLVRLPLRLKWEEEVRELVKMLDAVKPVIICGDLNVCHRAIDINNPLRHEYSPGYSAEERKAMGTLLECGLIDTYRHFHPDTQEAYTYWSYFGKARENNKGWRLDYFLVSERLLPKVKSSEILSDVTGSDHCPIVLELEV